MSLFKRIIIVFTIFVILTIIISFFLPSSITINKEIFFEADTKIVAQELATYSFSKEIDGFVIKKEDITYSLSDQSKGVLVTFNITLTMGFNPITKFKGLFIREKMDLVINENLNLLKLKIEDLPKIHKVNVEKKYRNKPLLFLSIRDTFNQSETSNIHGKLIEEVQQYILNNNFKETESPIVIYHYWSDSIVDIEAGIPIIEGKETPNHRIKLNKIDTGYYVTATHFGAYERLPETYFGINEWMRKNQVTVIGPPFEFYVTDPTTTTNQQDWITIINFPIK